MQMTKAAKRGMHEGVDDGGRKKEGFAPSRKGTKGRENVRESVRGKGRGSETEGAFKH